MPTLRARLYGSVPGGQAEYLRVRRADANAIVVGRDLPDERYLFLSDILPTAWQGVGYAGVPTLAVVGLGPVGQFAVRIGRHLGIPSAGGRPSSNDGCSRSATAPRCSTSNPKTSRAARATDGRGTDGVVDAVGLGTARWGGGPAEGGRTVPDAAGRSYDPASTGRRR